MRNRRLAALAAVFLALALSLVGCGPVLDLKVSYPDYPASPTPAASGAGHKLGALYGTVDRFSYLAGTTGTVTVAAHQIVTAMMVCAASAGTVTIAPSGPGITPVTGPSITIPAGICMNIPIPIIPGAQVELGDGTVFTFTGTSTYVITLEAGT